MDKSNDPVGEDYFSSYEDLEVHKIMLSDERRNLAYKEAIENHKENIEGKIILEVGAGTGLLSILCAKAGASKVYAIEASKGMIPILRKSCSINGVDKQVIIIEGAVEDVDLPEKVDLLISEWMGFYLVHEGMLSSVIHARDKFLKEDGIMIPDKGCIKACLCTVPGLFEFWEDVIGVNLSHVGELYRKRYRNEPAILTLEPVNIVSNLQEVAQFDLNSVTDSDLASISREIVAVPQEDGVAHGVCVIFEVSMYDKVFSTGPIYPPTHWKQTVLVFPDAVELEAGEGVAFEIVLTRKENKRHYGIELNPKEIDEVEHIVGCECSLPKCRIINAYLKTIENDNREESVENTQPESST